MSLVRHIEEEMSRRSSEILSCLAAIARAHKLRSLYDPKSNIVQAVVYGIRRVVNRDVEAK
ncbi:19308_t:CDS:2 [Dentiscutata erythropus]|uniref:19308_t:CDS:1 n=1 Tax=Dentiscutata erythropus TaxID=1348616 RepID=A0A9N9E9A5_9GLOM|nr:19308_t:CDS:2 [Dentiscutata erythropus]